MKKILWLALTLIAWQVKAQNDTTLIPEHKDTTYWTKTGMLSLTASQVSLQNWAAGGQNSIAVNGLVSLSASYRRAKTSWDNMLDVGYGTINQNKLPWWEKSDDKIDLTSKYGYLAFDSAWFYSALLNFKTQFSPGYDLMGIPMADRKRISDFMAPAYLILALGLDYKHPNLDLMVAPATAKLTIVNNQTLADQGAFGVDKANTAPDGTLIPGTGKRSRLEFGGYIKMVLRLKLMENVGLVSKLDLFSNYLHNPGNIDVNWDVLVSMKINKYFSATLNTTLIYDDDINIARNPDANGVATHTGPITQFKEVFTLGFSYKFKNR